MTRKDYVALAKALHDSDAPDRTINAIAKVLADDNPRFDRQRFIEVAWPNTPAEDDGPYDEPNEPYPGAWV